MSRLEILDDIRIASPCKASWEDMVGDDRSRFCDDCALHVYNVAGLQGEEVINLIEERQGRLCMRLYQREDGTLLTKNCPRGLAAARRKVARVGLVLAVLLGASLTVAVTALGSATGCATSLAGSWWERLPIVAWLMNEADGPHPNDFDMGIVLMGDIEPLPIHHPAPSPSALLPDAAQEQPTIDFL